MRDFQRDKQARLNEVPIEVVVRARQVQCSTAEHLLPDASAPDALVIPSSWMERLNSRIQVRCGPPFASVALRLSRIAFAWGCDCYNSYNIFILHW